MGFSEGAGGEVLTDTKGTTTANWKTGVATSGLAGADLLTIGANDTFTTVKTLLVDVGGLTVGANVMIRLYSQVNGTEKKTYQQEFVTGVDPDGLWIIDGNLSLNEAIRCELFSDVTGDNGRSIAWEHVKS